MVADSLTWLAVHLGDIVPYGKTEKCELSDVTDDTWILELEDIERDSSKILKRLDITERPFKSTKNKFSKGDVLYGKLRPYLNKVVIADKSGVCSTEIIPLNAEPYLDNRYLFYWLKSEEFLGFVNSVSYGVNMPRLGTKDGLLAPFILAPLAEQKVIADKLDTLLAQVESTKARLERIPDILKCFRQSVLAAAVSGKLTEEWRDSKQPVMLSLASLKEIKQKLIGSKSVKKDLTVVECEASSDTPTDWLSLQLQSVALKITDGEHKTPKREASGRYLLSARNVRDGYITVDDVDYVGEDEFQKLRKRCDPNKDDILISCSGSVGRVCLVDEDDKYVMVRSAALVRVHDSFIKSKFLMYFLQSPNAQKNIEESSKSTAQSNLFLGPIKELEIVLPSIAEQDEIVRRVEELFAFADNLEQKAATALERVRNLTQSILAKAFRGELTADWRAANPEFISGENSAEALLVKIQTERKATAGKKTRKKA